MDKKILVAALALMAFPMGTDGAPKDELVAHEWGTFTSVHGADGTHLRWLPTIGTDLPSFVYSASVNNGGFKNLQLLPTSTDSRHKGSITGFMRMETPVIYFYSDSPRSVDVHVHFPQGRITEWYPQAERVAPSQITTDQREADGSRMIDTAMQSFIDWRNVQVLPRNATPSATLRREKGNVSAEHYYAARETDANLLSVNASGKTEHERLLFYRGVGYERAPLNAKLDEDETTLSLSSLERLSSVMVLSVRGDMMRYQQLDRETLEGETTVNLSGQPFEPAITVRERLITDMTRALVGQGLFEKEAQAMVATWKDQWFADEGMRVLYLLPQSWTERQLPLRVAPRPDDTVRVMVGRAELIAASVERALTKHINEFSHRDSATKERALAGTRELRLGRFLAPATELVVARNRGERFSQAGYELLATASRD